VPANALGILQMNRLIAWRMQVLHTRTRGHPSLANLHHEKTTTAPT
jgi:hypothetical protein